MNIKKRLRGGIMVLALAAVFSGTVPFCLPQAVVYAEETQYTVDQLKISTDVNCADENGIRVGRKFTLRTRLYDDAAKAFIEDREVLRTQFRMHCYVLDQDDLAVVDSMISANGSDAAFEIDARIASPGKYTILMTVTDSFGNCKDSAPMQIEILPQAPESNGTELEAHLRTSPRTMTGRFNLSDYVSWYPGETLSFQLETDENNMLELAAEEQESEWVLTLSGKRAGFTAGTIRVRDTYGGECVIPLQAEVEDGWEIFKVPVFGLIALLVLGAAGFFFMPHLEQRTINLGAIYGNGFEHKRQPGFQRMRLPRLLPQIGLWTLLYMPGNSTQRAELMPVIEEMGLKQLMHGITVHAARDGSMYLVVKKPKNMEISLAEGIGGAAGSPVTKKQKCPLAGRNLSYSVTQHDDKQGMIQIELQQNW